MDGSDAGLTAIRRRIDALTALSAARARLGTLGFDTVVSARRGPVLSLRVDLTDPAFPAKAAAKAPVRVLWTKAMDAAIDAGRRDGLTVAQIAAQLGVTYASAAARIDRLTRAGVAVPPPAKDRPRAVQPTGVRADGTVIAGWTKADCADLIQFYDVQGLTLAQIAERLGRSLHAVAMRLARMRIAGQIKTARAESPHALKWTPERLDQLRAQWATVAPVVLAAEFGISRSAVLSMAYRLGLPPRKIGRPAGSGTAKPARKPKVVLKPKAARKPVGDAPRAHRVAKSVAKAVKAVKAVKIIAAPEQKFEPKPDAVRSHYRPVPAPVIEPVAPLVPDADQTRGFQTPKGAGLITAPLRGGDFGRPAARFMPGMTDRQKAEAVAAHIAGLLPEPEFSEVDDLALCEALFAGRGLAAAAALIRVSQQEALDRFNAIVAPMRNPDARGLPIEAAAWVLPCLRTRLKGDAA